jgi:hypothetical protein
MKALLRLLLPAVLASCAVAPAVDETAAADLGRRVEFGILGGSSSATAGVSTDARYERRITTHITDGNVFGLRLGGNINRFLGIDMTFANAGSDYDAYLVGPEGDTLSRVNTTSIGLLGENALNGQELSQQQALRG